VFLVAWGIILRSVGEQHDRTYFTFEDTLTQIGLGYFPLFLLGRLKPLWWWVAIMVLLGGIAAAFIAYPLPPADFDYPAVGVPADWPYHSSGVAAHWNKNSNLAWAADVWFLNLFPREAPFTHNGGGYATLSFVPTLATMLFGVIAGHWLHTGDKHWWTILLLVCAGCVGLAAGRALHDFQLCPIVKRIWTPSWTLLSAGWCFLILALFYATTDAFGYAGWTYPLRVIGANSILIYTIAELPLRDFVLTQIAKHLPPDSYALFGETYSDQVRGGLFLVLAWLFLWWLYRKRLFVRI
jgi:predicted acyltransferase